METLAQEVSKILATLESQEPESPTVRPLGSNNNSRRWLDKWIRLRTNHNPQLEELEQAVFRFCAGYSKLPNSGHILVLFGNNGTGKTHTARAIKKWADHVSMAIPVVRTGDDTTRLANAKFVHWPTFLDNLKAGQWESVDDCEAATLLILDEVGGGYDPSKMGLDKLCRILSCREHRWTLVTTNCLPESWEDVFDRRVASRLFRQAEHVDLTQVPDFSTVGMTV